MIRRRGEKRGRWRKGPVGKFVNFCISLVYALNQIPTKIKIMKTLKWIAWISGGIGVLFLVLAVISFFLREALFGGFIINFCIAASSFFLLAIMLYVFIYGSESKK
jgi:uncharacterized membrane-anchored protein